MMIPEHRMAELLTQVKEAAIRNCPYHNTRSWPSLYTDHVCDQDDFPLDTVCELDRHTDEVWFIAFSNDGTRLATASKDSVVVIYETQSFQILHILAGHKGPVGYLSWSPDDTRLITCAQIMYPAPTEVGLSKEHCAQIWDTETGSCLRTINKHNEPVTTAAWSPDGRTFVTGSLDRKHPLVMWSVTATSDDDHLHIFGLSNLLDNYPAGSLPASTPQDFRVQDCSIAALSPSSTSLAAAPDQQSTTDLANRHIRLAAVCARKALHIFDYRTRQKLARIQYGYELTSVNYARDGLELLINLSNGELWTVDGEQGVANVKFYGRGQDQFVIRSTWGGATEGVVVSGGEGMLMSCSLSYLIVITTDELSRWKNQHLASLHGPSA